MTGQEIICTFMEPKPTWSADPGTWTVAGWWWYGVSGWVPDDLDLTALWEVEERLTDEQWERYRDELVGGTPRDAVDKNLTHATPELKIWALAHVLKPLMEAA